MKLTDSDRKLSEIAEALKTAKRGTAKRSLLLRKSDLERQRERLARSVKA